MADQDTLGGFSGAEVTQKGVPRGWNPDSDDQQAQRDQKVGDLLDAYVHHAWAWDVRKSVGLKYAHIGGVIQADDAWSKVPDGEVTLADNALNYVQRTTAGVVSANVVGFDVAQIPMSQVETKAGVIKIRGYADCRPMGAGAGTGGSGGDGDIGLARLVTAVFDQVPTTVLGDSGELIRNLIVPNAAPGDYVALAMPVGANQTLGYTMVAQNNGVKFVIHNPNDGERTIFGGKYLISVYRWDGEAGGGGEAEVVDFLNDIGDVNAPGPQVDDGIFWDGGAWVNKPAPVAAILDGSGTADFMSKWTGPTTLGDSSFQQTGNQLLAPLAATAALPAWSYQGRVDQGMWSDGDSSLGFAVGGVGRAVLQPSGFHPYVNGMGDLGQVSRRWGTIYANLIVADNVSIPGTQPDFPIIAPNGTAGAPSYSFAGPPTKGMYAFDADSVDFSVTSARRFSISALAVTSFVTLLPATDADTALGSNTQAWGNSYIRRVRAAQGSEANPAFSFEDEETSGISYSVATTELRFGFLADINYRMNPAAFSQDAPVAADLGLVGTPWGALYAGAGNFGGPVTITALNNQLLTLNTITPGTQPRMAWDFDGVEVMRIAGGPGIGGLYAATDAHTFYVGPVPGFGGTERRFQIEDAVVTAEVPVHIKRDTSSLFQTFSRTDLVDQAWAFQVDGNGEFELRSKDDANVTVNTVFQAEHATGITRWNNPMEQAAGAAGAPSYSFSTAPSKGLFYDTVSANIAFVGGVVEFQSSNPRVVSTAPAYQWLETDAPVADEGGWRMVASGGVFYFQSRSDTLGAGDSIFNIQRIGLDATEMQTYVKIIPVTAALDLGSVGNPWDKIYVNEIIGPSGGVSFPLLAPDGTGAAPSYSFTSQTGSGMFLSGVELRLATEGVGRFFVDSTEAKVNGVPLRIENGSAGAPAIAFTGDTDTGMYWGGTDIVGFAVGGTLTFDIAANRVKAFVPVFGVDGSAVTPSYSFSADQNTGMLRIGADLLSFAAGGSEGLRVAPGQAQGLAGSAVTPSFAFTSDTNTGMYRVGSNIIGFTAAGVQQFTISNARIQCFVPFRADYGTVLLPGIAFDSDGDTGFWRRGSNQIGIACGGVEIALFHAGGFQINAGTAVAPTYSFIGDSDTGMYKAGNDVIGFSAGGALRYVMDGTQLYPNVSNTYDLGTSSRYWESIFVNRIWGDSTINFITNDSTRWQLNGSGNWQPWSDSTYDIGVIGGVVRSVYATAYRGPTSGENGMYIVGGSAIGFTNTNIVPGATQSKTAPVTGCLLGDIVILGFTSPTTATLNYWGQVTSSGTVQINATNNSSANASPLTGTVSFLVLRRV